MLGHTLAEHPMISPVPSNGAEGFIFSIALCRRSRGVCFVTRLLRYAFASLLWLRRCDLAAKVLAEVDAKHDNPHGSAPSRSGNQNR